MCLFQEIFFTVYPSVKCAFYGLTHKVPTKVSHRFGQSSHKGKGYIWQPILFITKRSSIHFPVIKKGIKTFIWRITYKFICGFKMLTYVQQLLKWPLRKGVRLLLLSELRDLENYQTSLYKILCIAIFHSILTRYSLRFHNHKIYHTSLWHVTFLDICSPCEIYVEKFKCGSHNIKRGTTIYC